MKKFPIISAGNALMIVFGFISLIFLFGGIINTRGPKVAGVTGSEVINTPIPTATYTPRPTVVVTTKAPTPIPTKKTVSKATLTPTNTTPPTVSVVENIVYKVKVVVVRSDNVSMANTQVTIDGKSYTLDGNSAVEISNIDLGNHNVKADLNNKEVSKGFVLGEQEKLNGVTVILPIESSTKNMTDYSILYICVVLLIILILLFLIFFLAKRKKKDNKKNKKKLLK